MTRPGFPIVPERAPANVAAPSIVGTVLTGNVLAVSGGTWLRGVPYATLSYQWKRDGVAIGGATSDTYVVVAADNGPAITVTVTASNAAGSASATSAPVAFSLAQAFGASLKTWERSDVLVSSGGIVSVWTDQSGLGNTPSQATAGARPSLIAGALDGHDAVRFGAGKSLASSVSLTATGAAFTCLWVARDTTESGGTIYASRLGNTAADAMLFKQAGNDLVYSDGVVGANNASIADVAKTGGLYGVSFIDATGLLPQIRINGVVRALTVPGAGRSAESGSPGWILGSQPGGVVAWAQDIFEHAIVNRALSANETLSVEAYFRYRYPSI